MSIQHHVIVNVAVDGAEKPVEADHDSFFCLQMATWKPAEQRESEPLPRQTETADSERNFTEFNNNDVSNSSNKSTTENLSRVKKMSLISSAKYVSSKRKNAGEAQFDGENIVDGHQRGRSSLPDLSLMSVDVCTQSSKAALKRPRLSSVGRKRKSSAGKLAWRHLCYMLLYLYTLFNVDHSNLLDSRV